MIGLKLARGSQSAISVVGVDAPSWTRSAQRFGAGVVPWLKAMNFRGAHGQSAVIPDDKGTIAAVLVGVGDRNDRYVLSSLPMTLPAGLYRLADDSVPLDPQLAAYSWGVGAYRFTRYKKAPREAATLLVDRATLAAVEPVLRAITTVRDLVNTPTEDMGPQHLSAQIKTLANEHDATFREFVGAQLLKSNFPSIHTVGRASHRDPRLIELRWGKAKHPHLTVIGKGVCFDTGGLDMKSSDGMRWMKKDMGGAAHAIALAGLIMLAKLPVRLTLLVPAVENSIGGNAYRPGEVITTRAGITIEVDNTDAEGRLVLCDAITYAVEDKPDLIIDFATLTGAARVGLGPDLPALFTNRDELAMLANNASAREQDPMWRMPLWAPYLSMLDSRIADMVNAGSSRLAGAITAALFLQRFVPETTPWMHLDTYAWNDADRPGRPAGGEAQGLRTLFALVKTRYGSPQEAVRRNV
ncbi:MAG TPA: leucyl aminopeptidase family protein [Rudaea sp.]|jgi:leucyl aminopeptidase|nr:leucyl aminopeptidase family protein [Rudaea sp.]